MPKACPRVCCSKKPSDVRPVEVCTQFCAGIVPVTFCGIAVLKGEPVDFTNACTTLQNAIGTYQAD